MAKCDMNDWSYIMELLERKIPFSFAKFNDGELSAIRDINAVASRGFQRSSPELSKALKEALCYRASNYFVGIPCGKCYPELEKYCNEVVGNYENKVLANVLINSNVYSTISFFKNHLHSRRVIYVSSQDAQIGKLQEFLNCTFVKHYKVPNTNGWSAHQILKEEYKTLNDGDVVLFACGPLGRVLAYDWYKGNNQLTCIEIGSLFDPLTTGKCYLYQRGVLPSCEVCNPIISPLPFPQDIIESCYHKEFYYFQPWEYFSVLYKNNYEQLYNVYKSYQTYNKSDQDFYSKWMCARCLMKSGKKSLNEFLQIWERYPGQAEPLYEYLQASSDNNEKIELLKILKDNNESNNQNNNENDIIKQYNKWRDESLYDWKINALFIKTSYKMGNIKESYEEWKKMSVNGKFPHNIDGNYTAITEDINASYHSFVYELQELCLQTDRNNPYIHFIYLNGGYDFVMTHYIAIKSAHEVHAPCKILIHTDKEPENNKWWNLAKKIAKVIIIYPPSHVNGHYLFCFQHKADVIRLQILEKIGGIYFDLDILSLKSIREFLITDKTTMAYEIIQESNTIKGLCNCVIICPQPHNIFIQKWIDNYETKYGQHDSWWDGMSIRTPLELSKIYSEHVNILPSKAFLPIMYWEYDKIFYDNNDFSQDWCDSYTVHLWETEASKTNSIPKEVSYFVRRSNTFTKIFSRYVDDLIALLPDWDKLIKDVKNAREQGDTKSSYQLAKDLYGQIKEIDDANAIEVYNELIYSCRQIKESSNTTDITEEKTSEIHQYIKELISFVEKSNDFNWVLQAKALEGNENAIPLLINCGLQTLFGCRVSGQNARGYEIGKYLIEHAFKYMDNKQKFRFYDEVLVISYYVNQEDSYKLAKEWVEFLSDTKDSELIKQVREDPRYLNNIKCYPNHESLCEQIERLLS